MPLITAHFWMGAAVVVIWGLNFVVIKMGLNHGIPPFLLGALRFGCVMLPAMLWVPRPQVPWRWLIAYGLTTNLGQFGLFFLAMAHGMPAGLSSLILQTHVIFTLALSMWWFGERLRPHSWWGLGVAVMGLGALAHHSINSSLQTASMTGLGFVLTLGAAFSWALGNMVSKRIHTPNLLGVVIWSAWVPLLPFITLSWVFEGPERMQHGLMQLQHWPTALAVAYLAYVATILAYTLWGKLLQTRPTQQVAPLTLLVPVVGMSSAWLLLDEQLSGVQIVGAMVILAGLALHGLGQFRHSSKNQSPT